MLFFKITITTTSAAAANSKHLLSLYYVPGTVTNFNI